MVQQQQQMQQQQDLMKQQQSLTQQQEPEAPESDMEVETPDQPDNQGANWANHRADQREQAMSERKFSERPAEERSPALNPHQKPVSKFDDDAALLDQLADIILQMTGRRPTPLEVKSHLGALLGARTQKFSQAGHVSVFTPGTKSDFEHLYPATGALPAPRRKARIKKKFADMGPVRKFDAPPPPPAGSGPTTDTSSPPTFADVGQEKLPPEQHDEQGMLERTPPLERTSTDRAPSRPMQANNAQEPIPYFPENPRLDPDNPQSVRGFSEDEFNDLAGHIRRMTKEQIAEALKLAE
jgi:hypothetical protein